MTGISELAAAASDVAATSSRKAKAERLAALLANLTPAEIAPAVGMLTADVRQGAIGVGWATVSRVAPRGTGDGGSPPTIADFDELLTTIAETTGPGSERVRDDLLARFLGRCDEASVAFVRRVLIGEARLGALAGVMVEAVAKASGIKAASVRRAVMLHGDIGHTATMALAQGSEAIEAVEIEVGRPIQPMLAATAGSVEEAMTTGEAAIIEWKLDGARIQVHRWEGDEADTSPRIRIVTRNLNDITARLPSVVDLVAGLDCRSAVLDGEIIGVDLETGTHDPDDRPAHQLKPFFFDLMFLDGTSLIDEPLTHRSSALRALVGDAYTIPSITTDQVEQADAHLEAALAAGHEGVMVKGAASTYQAGRRGKAWRKVKPVHTFDLVVLAAEWGYGRRTGKLSNLHLGARDPDRDDRFLMVGKTFKGLTDDLLAWQTETFQLHQDDARSNPSTVAVHPRFVVEIAVDGVQQSTRYPGGVALRFARVKAYRPDKTPAQADTIHTVQSLLKP